MQNLHKYIDRNAFKGYLPDRSDFEIVEEAIPGLKDGEFLVRAEYISVDPYMRSFASDDVPYSQFGFQVGRVVDTRSCSYPQGKYIVSHAGWTDHAVLNGDADDILNVVPYEPDVGELPISLAVGALGMPGITAYLGFLEICKPKPGDVVCVTSAAGAVGSLVGQIAKLKGCTVIGFAGSDEKVQILIEELGFDYAFNYKTISDVKQALQSVVPRGIDCYFDNVGGDLAAKIMENIKGDGRVAICGAISTYGSKRSSRVKKKSKSIKIESFGFTQWEESKKTSALRELRKWLENGDIKAKETITNGFQELPSAFIGMLRGENIGKAVVKI